MQHFFYSPTMSMGDVCVGLERWKGRSRQYWFAGE